MRKLGLLPSLSFALLLSAISLFGQQSPSLGDLARQYRAAKLEAAADSASSVSKQQPAELGKAKEEPALPPNKEVAEYTQRINEMMEHDKFAELDQLADSERSSKARFAGGGWRLYTLYFVVDGCSCDGSEATDAAWTARIDKLKHWISLRPDSITAPIALAEAYLNYAWQARGHDFADKVTEDGWKPFGERVQLARDTLEKAATLSGKCPEWYHSMLRVALAQGWDKEEESVLFRRAIAFEPEYQYLYRLQAQFLLPRWFGDEGESAQFAEEVSNKIGGAQGNIIYFEIAGDMICDCGSDDHDNTKRYSWTKIQQGYKAIEQKFGSSAYKLNQLAYMAVQFEDDVIADQAFRGIGDRWDEDVWGTKKFFDENKQWASASAEATISLRYQAKVDAEFEQEFTAATKHCLDDAGMEPGPVDIFLRIGLGGHVEQVMAAPPLKECLTQALKTASFSAPPKPGQSVRISMDLKR